MTSERLQIQRENIEKLRDGRLVLAFSGWMDGGDVSTGTVKRLIEELDAEQVAEIRSEGFYISSFPGDMEVSSLFRPHIRIEDGIVKKFETKQNRFYLSAQHNLAFFVGEEPNLQWREFGECVFGFAKELGVSSLFFVGSFAGSVPHTREPRLHVSVSRPGLQQGLEKYGLRPTNYEGPGSFMTYLMTQASGHGLEMINIAAEIPAYLNGTNPSSIEAVTRRLAAILRLRVDLSKLRARSHDWESQVSQAVLSESGDMAEQIRKLEEQYDDDLIESPVDGLPEFDLEEDEKPQGPDAG